MSHLPDDKTNKMACAHSEDSDQTGHPPSLIRVFAVRMKKAWVLSYPLAAQRRLIRLGSGPCWSESSLDAQAILLNLRWLYIFVERIKKNLTRYPSYFITKTYLYYFDTLTPHFYIVKLGFTGVYIIFLISAQKHRLWVLVRTASPRRF